jgi:uncharacterized protein
MYVAAARIRLSIPGSQSLKDKRQVLDSITKRARNKFEVAIAEVADNDAWQSAVIGLAAVANEAAHAERILRATVAFIEQTRPDVEALDVHFESIRLD